MTGTNLLRQNAHCTRYGHFLIKFRLQIIHSLTTGSPLASGIAWCTADSTYDDYASQCEQFCVRTVELNAHVSELLASISRTPKDMDRVKDVIQQCHSLDQHFVRWTDAVPDEFRWETVDWQVYVPHDDYANADVFPGRVDVYADSWIAIVWTMARWSRIVLLSVLVRATAWLHLPKDYRSTQEYATAARLCTETITDVIASVPYQLGYVSNPHKSSTKTRQSGAKRGDSTVQRSMTAVLLAWALNGLQSQDHVTEAQRVWIKGRLNVIGTHLGIGYGTLLAKVRNIAACSPILLSHVLVRWLTHAAVEYPGTFHANPSRPSTIKIAQLEPCQHHHPRRATSTARRWQFSKYKRRSKRYAKTVPRTPSHRVAGQRDGR